MIGIYFSIIPRLFAAHVLYLTGLKFNKKLYYASIYLFSKQSFRLPQSAKSDVLIIIRRYLATVKKIVNTKPMFHNMGTEAIAAFDSDFIAEEKRLQYLAWFNVKPGYFFSREYLNGSVNFLHACIHLFFVSLFTLLVLPFSFSRRRVSYALLLTETVEWANLLWLFKKHTITKVYHHNIYEKDANFLAYLLMKRNVSVSKITSEVPLVFANKIILTNELCLCFAYQAEEAEAFKETMFYDKLTVWLPEMQISYIDKYKNKVFDIPVNAIGFYSSAFWLRKKLNHSIADVGSYDVEENLLGFVAEYLKRNETLRMVVFTHPYEKNTPENYKLAMEHYSRYFPHELMSRVEFTGQGERSTDEFQKVNIGISVFSTIMFERISLGFKTILAPLDKKDFPLEKSPFRNICAYSKEELFRKLDENLPYSKKEFFDKNNIPGYFHASVNLDYKLN